MGRPTGSTTGRVPEGGYPSLTHSMGAFLAGFIEGEGCFGISRQPRGRNYRCLMRLTVRDDEMALLEELREAVGFGSFTRRAAYRSSRPQVSWNVGAKSDCARLVEILDEYPLRGKKSYDYAIWRSALQWWIGLGADVYEKNRDWAPMSHLKAELTRRKLFDEKRPPYPMLEGAPDRHQDWRGYISGLLTADGSLGIVRNGSGFNPVVHITLRADDRPLLEEIRTRVGAGHLYDDRSPSRTPAVQWIVRNREGLLATSRYLDDEPPRGKRGREFAIWRQAVDLYASTLPRSTVRKGLAEHRQAIKAMREYSPPV